MIRALVVEDSLTVQEFLVEVLRSDPQIEVVGTAKNGLEGIEMTKRLRPSVVVMDINMPKMDGLEATKRIMIESPTPIVIVTASMNVRDVNVSMSALRAGALALLDKPLGIGDVNSEVSARHLVATVKAMAEVKVVRHWAATAPRSLLPLPAVPRPPRQIRVIAAAASTGGPAALARLLADLPASFPVPIVIVQHIAQGFVGGFASWLSTVCPLRVKIAADGEPLLPSTVYLAGEGGHTGVSHESRIVLDSAPAIGGFRPSATYLFDSAGKAFGPSAMALMLTGMGQDGVDGLRALRANGGQVVAQDESSSIVFGMPGAAIAAGLADCILPLPSIGPHVVRMVRRACPGINEE